MNTYRNKRQALINEVLVEPATSKLRPKLISLIKLLTAHAKQLSKDDLYSSAGADIASTLCGALAWQGANGVDGDDWINEKNEPVLFALMSVSSALDIDNSQPDKWDQLFETVESIENN